MPTQTRSHMSGSPVTFVYPLVQKHFTKGVIIGAVKG
ncbi:ABC-type glycerol-3-phosphate transport system permease component [Nocardiopsis metallicus]|uniref:ABC-type glycerol-3-phosphate transport system permease component n=1 Tax=Nocardiopsis metallicus TaxID=179819 RepID=A0A840WNQ8_9ACTN|nr:ABC-type glycerol-3-phosphate transport system permease component [Nocardiopsis metallicus]